MLLFEVIRWKQQNILSYIQNSKWNSDLSEWNEQRAAQAAIGRTGLERHWRDGIDAGEKRRREASASLRVTVMGRVAGAPFLNNPE
ncbi:hypothetical protein BFG06_10470 [Aeromonas caviae]|nr:hypothetical protein BFG06_10470 [Aeromonas caviae]